MSNYEWRVYHPHICVPGFATFSMLESAEVLAREFVRQTDIGARIEKWARVETIEVCASELTEVKP